MGMDAQIVEKRSAWLDDLDAALSQTSEKVNSILSAVEWTKEHLLDNESVNCPHQPAHCMPQSAMKKHLEYCPLVEKGYTREELEKEQGSLFFYEKATCVVPVFLDETVYQGIKSSGHPGICGPGQSKLQEMPATMQRAQQEMSPAERLALYDYCVEKAKESRNHVKIPEEELLLLTDNRKAQNSDRPISYIERLAECRDLKRRRQSYRAKNVHTTKKSNTEIIREVIDNQMKILGDLWQDGENDTESSHGNVDTDSHRKSSRDREVYKSRNGSSSREMDRSKQDGRGEVSEPRYRRREDDRHYYHRRHRSRSYERDQDSDRSDDSRQYKYDREGSSDRQHKHKKHKKHKHKHSKVKKEKENSDEESGNVKEVTLPPQS